MILFSIHLASVGGALFINEHCNVTFEGNFTITISNNQANNNGRALFIRNTILMLYLKETLQFQLVIIKQVMMVELLTLYATLHDVTFEENSTVTLSSNQVYDDSGTFFSNGH